jgi:hypothetical protein
MTEAYPFDASFEAELGETDEVKGVDEPTARIFRIAQSASLEADEVAAEYLRNRQESRLFEIE